MKMNLTGIESDKLNEALYLVYTYKTENPLEEKKWEEVRKLLNGKTAEQVFDFAEAIALENNIVWKRNSAPNPQFKLNTPIIEPVNPDEDYSQIEHAKDLKIQVITYNTDSLEGDDEMMIFPSLVDGNDNPITFTELPLKLLISIKNNDKTVYTSNFDFTSSDISAPNRKRGAKISFKMLNPNLMENDLVDIECKLNTPFGYFSAYKRAVKVIIPSKSEDDPLVKQISAELAKETVSEFLRNIGRRELLKAYNLSQNPKWNSFEKFSDPQTGYGGISEVEIFSVAVEENSVSTAKVLAKFKLVRGGIARNITQNFTLKKINEVWKITDSKVINAQILE